MMTFLRYVFAYRSTIKKPSKWLIEALDGHPAAAGQAVSETRAMGLAAVFSCVRVRAESISSIPLKLYRRTESGRDLATDHYLYNVLYLKPNPIISSVRFREMMSIHLDLWGNFYAEIQRDNAGRIIALWPIPPSKVEVRVDTAGPEPAVNYKVQGARRVFERHEIFHVIGFGGGAYKGKSIIRMHREGLSIAFAAEKYGAKFFANDARPGLVALHPGEMGDTGQKNFKKSWNEDHAGADRAWRIKVLEEGMDIKQIGLPPGDAQFIETRKYQKLEVCSLYRVPPHKVSDLSRATFSNIESQQIDFVDSLRPGAVRIEQEIQMQLLSERDREEYYAEHKFDAILRGDTQSRFTAYATARQWGWLSANDIRAMENLSRVDGGDVYLQPLNMVPAGEMIEARSAILPAARSIERRALPARYGVAKALERVFKDVFVRAFKREIVEIRKAVKRFFADSDNQPGFEDWVVAFAGEQAQWMTPRVMPVYQSMAEAIAQAASEELSTDISADELGDFMRRYAERFTLRHTGSTRGQMLALSRGEQPAEDIEERLAEWEETRANKAARDERVRSASAVTRAAFTLAGVATLIWRTVGENCPICDELSGRTISITDRFLSAGDTIADLTTSSNISGPPVHQGCDCILMPGAGARSSQPEIRALLDQLLEDSFIEIECTHA